MTRFILGLLLGVVAGVLAYWLSHGNVALAIFVGLMLAMIVWFTKVADEIIEFFFDVIT